jgi:hypothetical protein
MRVAHAKSRDPGRDPERRSRKSIRGEVYEGPVLVLVRCVCGVGLLLRDALGHEHRNPGHRVRRKGALLRRNTKIEFKLGGRRLRICGRCGTRVRGACRTCRNERQRQWRAAKEST